MPIIQQDFAFVRVQQVMEFMELSEIILRLHVFKDVQQEAMAIR